MLTLCSFAPADNGERRDFVGQHLQYVALYTQPAGIPAAITLAQAILESNCGKSELAREANNFFGIKGGDARWPAPVRPHKDDEPGASLFRVYESVEHCYRNYAEFLHQPRYQSLYEIPQTDYVAWAYGLKKAGYATSATYAEDLIRIIEELGLQKYDRELDYLESTFALPPQEVSAPSQKPPRETLEYVEEFAPRKRVRTKQQRRGGENAPAAEAADAEPRTSGARLDDENFEQEAAAEEVQQQQNAPVLYFSAPTPAPVPAAASPLRRSETEVQHLRPKSKN